MIDKLDMFQSRFGKIYEFGLWDLEKISLDAGTPFTSTELQDSCQTRGVHLMLESLEHQEMNRQFKLHGERYLQLHTNLSYIQEF